MAPACHVAALLGYTGIRLHAITCNSMKVLKHLPKTGRHLRTRRLSLGLTLSDVYVASLSLARELRKPAFVLPPSERDRRGTGLETIVDRLAVQKSQNRMVERYT
jgi:hypothetical protein